MSTVIQKPKLTAKVYSSTFSPVATSHEILDKWEAVQVADNQYKITRKNKTELVVSVGDVVPNIGTVSVEKNKNLIIGKYAILTGENFLSGWDAKPARGKEVFRVRTIENKFLDVKIGDSIDDLGLISYDENTNKLKVGEFTIPISFKQHEHNLIVFDTVERGGKRAFFNYLEPDNPNNRKDGIQGVFYSPPGENRPSRFCEHGPDGKLYATAVFWPSKNKEFINGKLREIGLAIEEKSVVDEINKISLKMADVQKESDSIGFDIQDHPEYNEYVVMQGALDQLQSRLSYLNKEAWTSETFSVSTGHMMLGLKSKASQNTYTP